MAIAVIRWAAVVGQLAVQFVLEANKFGFQQGTLADHQLGSPVRAFSLRVKYSAKLPSAALRNAKGRNTPPEASILPVHCVI